MKTTPLADWLLAQPDLLCATAGEPLNRRLFETIRTAIFSGRLHAGQRLPPTRDLAQELGIARNTVTYAYDRLNDEGYTVSTVGSGTYVGHTLPDPALLKRLPKRPPRRAPANQPRASRVSQRAQRLLERAGASEHQVGAFVPGIPDISRFPLALWQRLLAKRWKGASAESLGYGSSCGYPPLKRALAEYLRLARGVQCEDEQILVTHGAHQALDLCARVLADPNDEAWIEDPCYWGARSVFAAAGLKLRALPVDSDGLVLKVPSDRPRATQTPVRPRLIFATPSHQYPSGAVMSLGRRLLLEFARRNHAWIIEDDYDSEFRYQGAPLPSLQGLDAQGQTIYVGSFSKTLFPGLRLGFLVLPDELVEVFARLQSELYRGRQLVPQAALAEFIAEGHYAAHVRRMRKVYAQRQAILTAELRRQLGARATILGASAGLHLTLRLRDAHDVEVSVLALARGIVARPLSLYSERRQSAPAGLVLGYGGVQDEQIAPAVAVLEQALAAAMSSRPQPAVAMTER